MVEDLFEAGLPRAKSFKADAAASAAWLEALLDVEEEGGELPSRSLAGEWCGGGPS